MRIITASVALILALGTYGGVGGVTLLAAEDAAEITEWTVPWENTRPRDAYVDGQGRVWFVGQRGDYVAYLEPTTGEFKRYDLEPGTGPITLSSMTTSFGTPAIARRTSAGLIRRPERLRST